MIPVKKEKIEGSLPGVTEEFSAILSGKAFTVLSDTLYTDKVLSPMREYMTNAFDAHVDAGNFEPFNVNLPTQLEPTFSVRDFGNGLSHDDVIALLTRMFASSKENTNDQTGYLGLGSKSAFAYTNIFFVTSWFNGEELSYVASKGDEKPVITLNYRRPSDEPSGILVSWTVKAQDIHRYKEAAEKVVLAYYKLPVQPRFNLTIENLLEQDDLKMYEDDQVILTEYQGG